jgi:hypothetical protein
VGLSVYSGWARENGHVTPSADVSHAQYLEQCPTRFGMGDRSSGETEGTVTLQASERESVLKVFELARRLRHGMRFRSLPADRMPLMGHEREAPPLSPVTNDDQLDAGKTTAGPCGFLESRTGTPVG